MAGAAARKLAYLNKMRTNHAINVLLADVCQQVEDEDFMGDNTAIFL